MSERLDKRWMPDNEQAFGPKGKEGDIGEANAAKLFDLFELTYIHHKANEDKQNAGKDFELLINGEWIGVDIKANIHNDGDKKVCVEYPKLKKSGATYWLHINNEDPLNDFIIYPVEAMIEFGRSVSPVGAKGLRWVFKDIAENLKNTLD